MKRGAIKGTSGDDARKNHAKRKCTPRAAASRDIPDGGDMASSPPVPDIKVSFLVISYADKISRYMEVADCLKSIFEQTDRAWEVLLLHDGPNEIMRALWQDSLRDMPQGFHSRRVRYFECPHRGQRGGHALVDTGRHMARGEFVVALNGDNKVRSTYVEKMWRPDADIVTCQVLMRDMPGLILSGRGFMRGRIDRLNYMIRTSIAEKVSHKMHIDADYDWLTDCWDYANSTRPVRVHHVDEILGEHK